MSNEDLITPDLEDIPVDDDAEPNDAGIEHLIPHDAPEPELPEGEEEQ